MAGAIVNINFPGSLADGDEITTSAFAKENSLPFSILEDHQVTTNGAEIHTNEADLWFCLEGNVTFVCGGEMINPIFRKLKDGTEDKTQIKAPGIKDGTAYELEAGDWLWIPAGVPHQHNTSSTARLMIVKIRN